MTFTVAGQADIRKNLNADGLGALGLAAPLLAPAWSAALPLVDAARLRLTVADAWYAPLPGMLVPVANGLKLGLSGLDGAPAEPAAAACVAMKIHPQARLRLERAMVATLEPVGGMPLDQSLRPVPATILIRSLAGPFTLAQQVTAGDPAMPAGEISMYDERGLIVDPFAFAAAVDALLANTPALGVPMPAGAPAGTPLAIATAAGVGRFAHVVDLHGRPWVDPPTPNTGISFYTGAAGARVKGTRVAGGGLYAWPGDATAVIGAETDPDGAAPTATSIRVGWSTVGALSTTPIAWPGPGARTPVRDTLRLAAVDPTFHLLGNRAQGLARDGVGAADALTAQEPMPIVRQGSPVTLLTDGRSVLGWFEQVILGLQGGVPTAPFATGPIFAASVTYDGGAWPLPVAPGAAGQWPVSPAATPVPGSPQTVLSALGALRTGLVANWIAGSNDVLVTLPAGLPVGVAVRLYPISILLGASPDEQPLLRRGDGGATIVGAGANALMLTDPFNLGPTPARAGGATLRADAIVAWQPTGGGLPQVRLLGNLACGVGADVARPAPAATNLLGMMFWRGQARNPLIGAGSAGSFALATVFADPVAFVQSIVRQLTTDKNPRESPRLPTMSRTESLLSLQLTPPLAGGGADLYRSVLSGGWLTAEIDSHSYRLGNPGAAGAHEVHAPGVAATSQLGFDLWVAAAHRARPVVPTADIAGPLVGGPNAGLPNNWVLLQANATSQPPAPPAAPSTIAGAVLQTVPAYVETPELALIPDDSVDDVQTWITSKLGGWVATPNDTELHRQMVREVRSCKYGRRDAQWALRRAIRHARDLVYIETPLLGATAHPEAAPTDPAAAVDLVAELATRLSTEPRLRVVILIPREPPFVVGFQPWSMFFYAARTAAAATLQSAAGSVDGPAGPRPRVVIAHPMGAPGRPLVIRSTSVIVDDTWALVGTTTFSRRGLTFDGATDVVLSDWQIDRGAGMALRTYRTALMAAHLGVSAGSAGTPGGAPPSGIGAPAADWVRLHQPVSAHEVFADLLATGGRGKLLPLWSGPDPLAPGAPLAHPPEVADPDGRGGASLVTTIAAAIGSGVV